MPTSKDALRELSRFKPQEGLGVLDKIIEKRKKASFVKYWEPQDQQRDSLKLFSPDKKIFALLGGNRSGKTDEGAFLTMAVALGKEYFRDEPAWDIVKDLPIPEPPSNIWVVALDNNVLRDVIWGEKFTWGRTHPPFLPENTYDTKRDDIYQIVFKNGSVITGKSAESGAAKFQSAELDWVWIDEEVEEDIYNECYQRTTSGRGGRILLTLTPLVDVSSGVRTPWVFDLHEAWRGGQKDLVFSFLSSMKSPYVPEEEKERLLAKWENDPEGKARLYGEFFHRSGMVYSQWDKEVHTIKPFKIPAGWTRYACIDPAPTGTTACLWSAVSPGGDLYLYREYYEADKVVSDHAKNLLLRCKGEPIDVWLIDPRGGNQRGAADHKTIADLYRQAKPLGIPVRLAELDSSYGLDSSREYMSATLQPNSRHPKLYVFNNLDNFKFEIERYVWASYQRGEQKGLSKDKPLKRHDHLMNCFQYICAQRPRYRTPKVLSEEDAETRRANNSYF